MSETAYEKRRLLRRMREEHDNLNSASKLAADAIYKLKLIHKQLEKLEKGE